MALDPLSMFLINLAVSFVVGIISSILSKPKPRKQENNVQRKGNDQELERVYGTRRMAMVVTNANTNYQEGAFYFQQKYRIGRGIVWQGSDHQERNIAEGDGVGLIHRVNPDTTARRITMMHLQGPVCVKGRMNAPFNQNKLTTPDDLDIKVLDVSPGDEKLKSNDIIRSGVGLCLYTAGNVPDVVNTKMGTREGNMDAGNNDTWTEVIHAYACAFQDLEKGKAKFTGVPEFTFMIESNTLWDPNADPISVHKTPTAVGGENLWTGRPDSPVLQLLDYLLDDEYGAGFTLDEINLDSFKEASLIANLQIGKRKTENIVKHAGTGFTGNNFYGGFVPGAGSNINFEDGNYNVGNIEVNKTAEIAPLLTSNITLPTDDTLSDNLSSLLAACRGARLFKNKLGKWTVSAAWMLEKDFSFTFNGDGTVGPYDVPFLPREDQGVTVKVNGNALSSSEYSFEAGGSQDADSTDASTVAGFDRAEFDSDKSEVVIYFTGTVPDFDENARYSIVDVNATSTKAKLSFVPSNDNGELVSDSAEKTKTFKGVIQTNFTGDRDFNTANKYTLQEIPNDANDHFVGLIFNTAVGEGDDISLDYVPEDFGAKTISAHLVRDPNDIGLDYDAIEDEEGNPLIHIVSDMSYAGVSIDDRYNQCIVRFPDEFNDYKNNEVEWPKQDSADHLTLLGQDNMKPLVNTVTVNHITNMSAARDYAQFVVRQSRSADQISFKTDYTGLGLEPNDIIYVSDPAIMTGNPDTLGDNSRYWRIVSSKLEGKGTIDFTCIRYEGEDYAYLSELLEDRKYQAISAPIPPVTFSNPPVEEFENKTAGFGLLKWDAPSSLENAFSYRVSVSEAKVYDAAVTYELDDIVWDEARLAHYKSKEDDNVNNPPEAVTSSKWERITSENGASLFQTIQASTDSTQAIIPNVSEGRFYTFRVEIITRSGLGPPAYISVNIAAVSFGVESTLRLAPSKPLVVIPQYPSVADWVSIDTYNKGQLVLFNNVYYVSLIAENTDNQPDTSTSQWRVNTGGILDFTHSDVEFRLYREDNVKPLNLSGGNQYEAPVDPEDADPDSWWFTSIVRDGVTVADPVANIGTVLDETDDFLALDDITAMEEDSLTASVRVTAVYKDENSLYYTVTNTLQYTKSTLGADGIDGGTVVQVSCYKPTEEVYDSGTGSLVEPAQPLGGSFNFTTGILNAPAGWTSTPPATTSGVVWVSSQIYTKAVPIANQPENLGNWSSPSVFVTYGGTIADVALYAKVNDGLGVPNTPAENSLIYSFDSRELLLPNGDPLPDGKYSTTASGSLVAADWYSSVPEGNGVVWVTNSNFAIGGTKGTDNTSVWTDATTIGAQGNSVFSGFLLKNVDKDAGIPTGITQSDKVAYNFDTERYESVDALGTPIEQYQGWYDPRFIPSLGKDETQYVIRETFTAFGAFGTDETSEWSDPVVFTNNPTDGKSGYLASVFYRAKDEAELSTPTGGSFDFDIGSLTTPTGTIQYEGGSSSSITWANTVPEKVGIEDVVIWTSTALATSDDPRGSDDTLTWTAPVILSREGFDGEGVDIIFARSDVQPNVPLPSDYSPPPQQSGQPSWKTDADSLTPSSSLPAWSCVGTRGNKLQQWIWQKPLQMSGALLAEISMYTRSESKPSAPTGLSYRFADQQIIPTHDVWSQDIPEGTTPVWVVKAAVSANEKQAVIGIPSWTDPVKVFQDGVDAKVVRLEVDQQAFIYKSSGELDDSSTTMFTATTSGFKAINPHLTFKTGATIKQSSLVTTYPHTIPTVFTGMPVTITVEAREDANGPVIATDSVSLIGTQRGSKSVSIILSNESHSISADANGNTIPSSYAGSGTDITVYQGSELLTPVNSEASLVDNSYFLSIDEQIKVTSGSLTYGTSKVTMGNVSNITDKLASVSFSILIRDHEGNENRYERVQSFTRVDKGDKGDQGIQGVGGFNGVTVAIDASKLAFVYKADDTLKDASASSSITAEAFNIRANQTAHYRFLAGNTEIAANTTGTATFTAPATLNSNLPSVISVEVRASSGTSGEVIARDTLTIIGLKEGGNAPSVTLSNEAQALATNSSGGGINYANSGTEIRVYSGPNACSYGAATNGFTVSAVGSGISPDSSPSGTGTVRTYGNASSMTTEVATITFTITVKDSNGDTSTVVKKQSFSKSKQGVQGAKGADGSAGVASRNVVLAATNQVFTYGTDGQRIGESQCTFTATASNTSGALSYKYFVNNNPIGSGTQASNSYTYTSRNPSTTGFTDVVEVELHEGGAIVARDQVTLTGIKQVANGADGADAITVSLSNEAHTVPANNAGAPTDFTGSGVDIKVWSGVNQCVYGAATNGFTVSTGSSPNITPGSASSPSSYTRRYGQITGFTTGADTGSILFNIIVKDANGDSKTVSRIQSFSKSTQGSQGNQGETGDDGGKGDKGDDGENGVQSQVIQLFKGHTSNTSPPSDIVGSTTWYWNSGAMGATNLRGWSTTMGNSSKYTWAITATVTAEAGTSSTNISSGSWSAPALSSGIGEDGEQGASGAYSGIINLFNGGGKPTVSDMQGIGLDVASIKASTYAVCHASNGTSNAYRCSRNNPNSTSYWNQVSYVDTAMVKADAIQAEQLQISQGIGDDRMYFNGGQNRIEIYAGGKLRIKLGKL